MNTLRFERGPVDGWQLDAPPTLSPKSIVKVRHNTDHAIHTYTSQLCLGMYGAFEEIPVVHQPEATRARNPERSE